jgi:hypothetical protein
MAHKLKLAMYVSLDGVVENPARMTHSAVHNVTRHVT